jgi:hypothetical protein
MRDLYLTHRLNNHNMNMQRREVDPDGRSIYSIKCYDRGSME